jgi:hypothetical protein
MKRIKIKLPKLVSVVNLRKMKKILDITPEKSYIFLMRTTKENSKRKIEQN